MKQTVPPSLLVLIDGSYFLYRAFYALQLLKAPDGTSVNAVFGFCRMLKKLLQKLQPSHLMIAWDSPAQLHRKEYYPSYKSQRQVTPHELHHQRLLIQEFAATLGIVQSTVSGYEADDILYSMVQEFSDQFERTVLVTADKDMAQLVTDTVVLYDSFKEIFLGIEEVTQKFGVPPARLSCYLSLVGDVADAIPGVEGIGAKTAQQLCKEYGSLEELYAHLAPPLSPALQAKLLKGKESAFMSRKLVTLQRCPLAISIEDSRFNADQWKRARPFFEKLGFQSFIKELKESHATDVSSEVPHTFSERYGYTFFVITTREQLQDLCAAIRAVGACALDTETTDSDSMRAELVGVSLCYETGTAYYLPIGHRVASSEQLSRELVYELLKPLLEDPAIAIYCHNAQFDLLVLKRFGVSVTVAFDTMVAASLVLAEGERLSLKKLSERFFQEEMISYKDVVRGLYKNFAEVPINAALDYAAADAHQTWKLVASLRDLLKLHQQEELYERIELPLLYILMNMTEVGILLDIKELQAVGVFVDRELLHVAQSIRATAGLAAETINLNAPRQIEKLLFEELKLEPLKKTASGSYSTDSAVLEELARTHVVPALLLQYRALFKVKTTYIDTLPDFVHRETGRIHAHFSQVSTATGRLACSDPNLQNIPVDRYGGYSIRQAFKAPPGMQFISADYSQIELRVLAHLSGDSQLKASFLLDEDIHSATASKLFKVPLIAVTHEQRQIGKRINFSILYGLTPYGLSRELRISLQEAKAYIDAYFANYPQISEWMASVITYAHQHGYVTTLWGRRREVPGIYEKNKNLYQLACRIAINTVAQGTAAEIMKLGMLALAKRFTQTNMNAQLILQIHDELLIAVPDAIVEETATAVQLLLEKVVSWEIPLRVTTRVGTDWGAVTK